MADVEKNKSSLKKRVLIVDDAALVRLFYRDALERAGFHVEEALNGLEAIEKLLVNPADLVIVDVNMPQMDGISFLRVLRRQEPRLASIPALVTSTESHPQDFDAARAAGANFYLAKSVQQEVLVEYAVLMSGQTA